MYVGRDNVSLMAQKQDGLGGAQLFGIAMLL
jgi:hypothetical protein